jgi:hypothetical protein
MPETWHFIWTDRLEDAYVALHARGGHWELEWGWRDPPGSDAYVASGHHRSSNQDEAVEEMLERVGVMSPEPDEAARVRPRLLDALEERQAAFRTRSSGGRRGA